MRRGGHQEVNRATGASIAQVVQGALVRGGARGEMATSWTGGVLMVSALQSQLGYWEVLDVDNALGGVWHVCTRSKHRGLTWEKMVGTGSIKVITCPVHIESRISATVSIFSLPQLLAPILAVSNLLSVVLVTVMLQPKMKRPLLPADDVALQEVQYILERCISPDRDI